MYNNKEELNLKRTHYLFKNHQDIRTPKALLDKKRLYDQWHDSWCGHGYANMEKDVYFPAVPLIIAFWEEDRSVNRLH